MNHRPAAALLIAVALLVSTGCTTYYAVHDPSTGKTYHTTKTKVKDGALTFRDATTRRRVTIQNSEIEKLTKDQYRAATR